MNDPRVQGEPSASTGLLAADFDLPAPRSMRARNWLSLGMVAVVFCAGVLVGVAAARTMQTPKPLASLNEIPTRVADRMQRDLHLSDDQRDRLEQIARSHQAQLRRIRAQIAPEIRAEMNQIIDEMAAVLSPEQAERWRRKAHRRLNALVPAADAVPTEPSSPGR